MCGICGIVDFKNNKINPATLHKMTDTLKHRGPGDSGIETLGPVGLGHARLNVIDLTSAAHQPMLSDDRQLALTYNGEVYNFPEIREKLEQKGIRFRSRSDTEVILRAYIEWGTDCFAMFNGMFAFAVWDARTGTLYLVRDRYGIKPVYYTLLEEGIIFGSEIKTILASGRANRTISWKGLHEYLYYGYGLGVNTLSEHIFKLQAGHYLMFSKDKCIDKPYWSIDEIEPVFDSVEKATEKVCSLLEKAVQSHLISDVPVGVFLSSVKILVGQEEPFTENMEISADYKEVVGSK
jgi:asparagine synthase (glutamine-hydrolysing)